MASNKKHHAVIGVFETKAGAERAIADLKSGGFKDSQIGFVFRDEEGKTVTGRGGERHERAGRCRDRCCSWRGGRRIGRRRNSRRSDCSGGGTDLGAGTLSTVLLNAAGGAAIAGIAGALIGWGIPDDDAKYYENAVKEGQYLVTVESTDRDEEARAILHRFSGFDRYGWQAVRADRQNTISAASGSSVNSAKQNARTRQTI